MNNKIELFKRYQPFRITAGIFIIIAAIIPIFSYGSFDGFLRYRCLYSLALIITGIALLVNNSKISIIGCCILFIYYILFCYSISKDRNGFFLADLFKKIIVSILFHNFLPFLIMIIAFGLENKTSFFLNMISIIIQIYNNKFLLFVPEWISKIISNENTLANYEKDLLLISQDLAILIGFLMFSIYLFLIFCR